jgi:hypothetical protein
MATNGLKNDIGSVNTGTGILERIVTLLDKYGIIKVLAGMILIIILSYTIFIALNPGYFIELYNKKQSETHNTQLTKRMEMVEMTNNEIEQIKLKTGADRVFIIEFHNSVKSIEGFPFAFGSMNFETCQDGVMYVSDEYTSFNLSKYKLISYIYKNNIYMGDVEGIKDIDNRLYYKFLSNDVEQMYLIKIEGLNMPIGILGLTYCDDTKVDKQKTLSIMRQEAVRMGIIMSKNQYNATNK